MLNKSVARRYAEAFFSLAREAEQIDEYQLEFKKVLQSVEEIENLKAYLAHPLIPALDKKAIARQVFADKVSPLTLNFLQVVIDKRREIYLDSIYHEYEEIADEFRNIKKAELTCASDFPPEEIERLAHRLSAVTGKTVQLTLKVDPSLLGGVKLKLGDLVVDGTIAKKLEMLKKDLQEARIS